MLVERVADASLGSAAHELGLEGTGGIDDDANLTLLNGSWLGELTVPAAAEPTEEDAAPAPVRLKGNFLASAPAGPQP